MCCGVGNLFEFDEQFLVLLDKFEQKKLPWLNFLSDFKLIISVEVFIAPIMLKSKAYSASNEKTDARAYPPKSSVD